MPTFDKLGPFLEDYEKLTDVQKTAFLDAIQKFVEDLRRGSFRKGLRVKRVQRRVGIWEMTWADDGRATFEYGEPVRPGHPHVVWRRIGSHDILTDP